MLPTTALRLEALWMPHLAQKQVQWVADLSLMLVCAKTSYLVLGSYLINPPRLQRLGEVAACHKGGTLF